MRVLTTIVAVASVASVALGLEPTPVSGRVVDEQGNPVADVRVAPNWIFAGGEANPYGEFEVGDDGTFRAEHEFYARPAAFVAYDDDLERAGIAVVQPDAAEDVVITIHPAVRVHARVTCDDLGGKAGWANSYWSVGQARAVSSAINNAGTLDLVLPRADWSYFTYGGDVKTLNGELDLTRPDASGDLGTIDLEANYIALNVGRRLEDWTVSDARNIDLASAQISKLRGRWVLVEFWGFW